MNFRDTLKDKVEKLTFLAHLCLLHGTLKVCVKLKNNDNDSIVLVLSYHDSFLIFYLYSFCQRLMEERSLCQKEYFGY